ncbi:MAG: S8 family serine peptidase [Chloroflexi bacterium]|nr:S8 family serine peptidase [Chloroflexota bacterium]
MQKYNGWLLFFISLLFLASSAAQAGNLSPRPAHQEFVPGEIIVQFKAAALTGTLAAGVLATGLPSVDALSRQFRARGIFPLFPNVSPGDSEGLGRIYIIRLPARADVLAAVAQYASDSNVEYAEPNYFAKLAYEPNDSRYTLGEQWNLNNTGQTINGVAGKLDADIDAPEAWDTTTGDPSTIIAIIDTGIDFQHPDLAGQIWTNPDEDIDDPPFDDDGNGYADDVNGWDFVNDDNDPNDDHTFNGHSHGSHVSGIAAAETNNATGVAGVCPNCRIMPLKVCNASGQCSWSDIAEAIQYAADNGAEIISMSLGGNCNKTVAAAVNYAWNNGLLIIAAAGNGYGNGIDWPARFRRVMAVGATNNLDKRASFSDYGAQLDLVAPGVSVLSSIRVDVDPLDPYRLFSGTSMATPHVAGVAGLIWSQNQLLTHRQVWRILIKTADDLGPAGKDAKYGFGRLNADRAVDRALNPFSPIRQRKASC